MKRACLYGLLVLLAAVVAAGVLWAADATYVAKIYTEIGGARQVIASGGSLDVESGGELDIESGGALKLAGTAVTASAAELNAVDGITASYAELNYLDVTAPGTLQASKAVIVNATKQIDDMILTDDLTVGDDAEVVGNLTLTGGDLIGLTSTAVDLGEANSGVIALTAGNGVTTSADLTVGDDLIVTDALTMQSCDQPIMVYTAAFNIEEATMDADDGTGIKVTSVTLNFAGKVLRAVADITQGYNEATDTLELVINNTDDVATPATTLVAAQDNSAAGLLVFNPSSSTTVPLATVSTTNKYVVLGYKDVGNDGGTAANLQGRLYVEYIRP